MSLDDRIRARFAELETASRQVGTSRDAWNNAFVDALPAQKWCTSVLNLLRNAFGASSLHYRNFKDSYDAFTRLFHEHRSPECFDDLRGIFMGAKEDYEGGHIFSAQRILSGELFGDFVVLAKQSLSEGYKDVAAVLACAALEDALKRYALSQDLDVQDKSM